MRTPRDHCIRCGECCLKSSPTLQIEDLPLLKDGPIEKGHIYTIRKGELTRDNINDTLVITPIELIKIAEKGGDTTGCIFYDEPGKACIIYGQRPAQCAALKCWDTSEFMRVYRGPKAERKDIVMSGVLLGMIEEHERRCNYFILETYVKQIEQEGERAVERILELLKFDYHLRPFASEKMNIDPHELDFLFGRPLFETITMFGLHVSREPDGSFFLTTKKTASLSNKRSRSV